MDSLMPPMLHLERPVNMLCGQNVTVPTEITTTPYLDREHSFQSIHAHSVAGVNAHLVLAAFAPALTQHSHLKHMWTHQQSPPSNIRLDDPENGALNVGTVLNFEETQLREQALFTLMSGSTTNAEMALQSLLIVLVEQQIGLVVGLDDPLMYMGLTSLTAIRFIIALRESLCLTKNPSELQTNSVSKYPTIRQLAAHIAKIGDIQVMLSEHAIVTSGAGFREALTSTHVGAHMFMQQEAFSNPMLPSLVEVLRTPLESPKLQPPLFLAAGGLGSSTVFAEMASQIEGQRFVFGLDRGNSHDVEALARQHARAIQELFPSSPIHIGGYSHGGWVAVRVAILLQEAGHTVLSVFVLDSYHMEHIPPGHMVLKSYLVSLGVPSALLEGGHDGKALRGWVSQQQLSLSMQAQVSIDQFGDELMQVLNKTGHEENLKFPGGWEDDPATPFSDLQTGVLFFNATRDFHGDPRADTLWCSACRNVTVIDIDVKHMQLLEQPQSFAIVLESINSWMHQTELPEI